MQVVEAVHCRVLSGPLVHLFGIGGIPTSGLSRYTVYSHCSGKGAGLEVFHQEIVHSEFTGVASSPVVLSVKLTSGAGI